MQVFISLLLLVACALAQQQPSELQIVTTYKPQDCTDTARAQDTVKVHYIGTFFATGEQFDSSHGRGQPLRFKLGTGQVIQGWDLGIQGMCLNEKRTLSIPSHLAYGSRGAGGSIPPNAALVFDVELVGLEPGKREEL